MPTLRILIEGRSDLPGPLCHYGLGRSGKVYVVAAGTANHAGSGSWRGLTRNRDVIGIEAENTGKEPWPKTQLSAYVSLVAAICEHLELDTGMVAGHKEWAPSRKPDPHGIDMVTFREWVDAARSPKALVAVTPPAQQASDIGLRIRRILVSKRTNDRHPEVRRAQGLLTAYSPVKPGKIDGLAGPKFEESVKAFQQQKGLDANGAVGEETWRVLEGSG